VRDLNSELNSAIMTVFVMMSLPYCVNCALTDRNRGPTPILKPVLFFQNRESSLFLVFGVEMLDGVGEVDLKCVTAWTVPTFKILSTEEVDSLCSAANLSAWQAVSLALT
jgi:hypothetical protein